MVDLGVVLGQCLQEQIVEISRRQVVGILGVAVAGFASTLAAPAQAGLFDDTEQVQAEYATRTVSPVDRRDRGESSGFQG
jgi:hypothetical protein